MPKKPKHTPPNPVAFLVLRVSGQRQAQRGSSISRIRYNGAGDKEVEVGIQEALCRDFCKQRGWEVGADPFIDAGVSGRRHAEPKRSGLRAAVNAAIEAKGIVLVYQVSRLGRSVSLIHRTVEELEDNGASFASATEPFDTSTAAGKALLGMLALFAEWESNQKSELTRASEDYALAKYGYRISGSKKAGVMLDGNMNLVDCPEELATLTRVREVSAKYRSPTRRFAQAAKELNALGVPTIATLRAQRRGSVPKCRGEWTGDLVRYYCRPQKGRKVG